MTRKLGKRPRRHDSRTLKLAKYLASNVDLNPPAAVDWSENITDWGMMLNSDNTFSSTTLPPDVVSIVRKGLGCCTIAAIGHAVQTWTRAALGRELTVPDADILNYYERWDGFNPQDPSTDQGGEELNVLNQFRQQGFSGVPLDAYVAVDMRAPEEWNRDVHTAVWLFGGLYIGVELPVTAENQIGGVWDVPQKLGPDDELGSWGGHAVYIVASDPDGLTCVTWGKTQRVSWNWFAKYCSEAYALVSRDWLTTTGMAPSGFNLTDLESDLALVTA